MLGSYLDISNLQLIPVQRGRKAVPQGSQLQVFPRTRTMRVDDA